MHRYVAPAVGLLVALAGCASTPKEPLVTMPQPGLLAAPPEPRSEKERLEQAILARDADALLAFLSHPDAARRAEAIRGIGRLQRPMDVPHVLAALQDVDALVRQRAAEASGLLALATPPPGAEAREAMAQALVARLDAGDSAVEREAIWSLGRLGGESALRALLARLDHETATYREEAAYGVGLIARFFGVQDREAVASRVAARLRDPSPAVRAAIAHALGWLAAEKQDEALAVLARDGDPLVRAAAARALGATAKMPSLAEALIGDPDLGVRVEAVRALQLGASRAVGEKHLTREAAYEESQRRSARMLAASLRRGDPNAFSPLLLLLRPSGGFAPHAVGHAAFDALGEPRDGPHARLRCLAAASADAGEGKIELVPGCSADHLDPIEEEVIFTRVLASIPGDEAVRRLQQLAVSASARVRAAAIEALAKREEPRARGLIVAALLDRDPAVVAAAAEAVARAPGNEALGALVAAWPRFASDAEAETAQSLLGALAALAEDHEDARSILASARRDPRPSVRAHARALAKGETADASQSPSPRPLFLPPERAAEGTVVVLDTDVGLVRIALDVKSAPVAAANFAMLVREGFYDGLVFHRVEPGFVVQGGDPRGDGFGGPGHAIPCERSSTRYLRGTVGMAHAGKDTAGSQFFVSLARTPHLEGRYTPFGAVTNGLERLERMAPGTHIRRAWIE